MQLGKIADLATLVAEGVKIIIDVYGQYNALRKAQGESNATEDQMKAAITIAFQQRWANVRENREVAIKAWEKAKKQKGE